MTLDEDLVEAIDKVTKELRTTRSAFTRKALREALRRHQMEVLERRHRDGYLNTPPSPDEFAVWEDEQDWGEE